MKNKNLQVLLYKKNPSQTLENQLETTIIKIWLSQELIEENKTLRVFAA